MPLKHLTETVLIIVLGLVTAVTGVLVGTLPPLPAGLLPAGIVFVLTLTYPLALYGLFRKNRADYWFRALHFAPMAIVLLWFVFETLRPRTSIAAEAAYWFTWAHAGIAVLLTIILTAVFCLHVIRRRIPRLSALFVVVLAFLAYNGMSERQGWRAQLAGALWQATPTWMTGSVTSGSGQMAMNDEGKNLSKSANPEEEAWREKLRAVVSKSNAATSKKAASSVKSAANSSKAPSSRASSSKVPPVAVKPPKRLPQSGLGSEVLAGFFVMGYLGTLHKRAKKRMHA